MLRERIRIDKLHASAYTIPSASRETDGTLEWSSTTLVIVEAVAGGSVGLGFTYADTATARFIRDTLSEFVVGSDAMAIPGVFARMQHHVRNHGGPGIVRMAISAVDVALWDLKAKLLDISLSSLLGPVHDSVAIYGSGGFTSLTIDQLREQLGGWVMRGIQRVKMKVGTHPDKDLERVRAARVAIGDDARLYVDANGAYSRKQTPYFAEAFADLGVSWFEEPVSSDDLEGLRLMRDRAPAGMEIAAGEYAYDVFAFRRLLEAGAVDVLQADATRCGGLSGYLHAAALAEAHLLPLSAHTAPSIHAHVSCSIRGIRDVEYFFDHVRIEGMLFDGVLEPVNGCLRPDRSRPGLGLEFKKADAREYAVEF